MQHTGLIMELQQHLGGACSMKRIDDGWEIAHHELGAPDVFTQLPDAALENMALPALIQLVENDRAAKRANPPTG